MMSFECQREQSAGQLRQGAVGGPANGWGMLGGRVAQELTVTEGLGSAQRFADRMKKLGIDPREIKTRFELATIE